MFRPKNFSELTRWSISEGEVKPTIDGVSKHYFIFYAFGKKPNKPFEFWCEFKGNPKIENGFVDFAIASHDIFGEENVTNNSFKEFIYDLPEIISPMTISSDLHLYSF